jgi:hypothetical protein
MQRHPIQKWDPRAALDHTWTFQRVEFDGADPDRERIQALRSIIKEYREHPTIHAFAVRILRQGGARARDYAQQARIIHGWVQRNLLFVHEAGDMFTCPDRVLFQGGGDCDCHTAVVGSLLETVRIPANIVVLRRNGRGFHVYAEAKIPPNGRGRWVPMETTLPVPMGWDPRKASPDEIRRLV